MTQSTGPQGGKILICILLFLAALQCGRASFLVNVSYIDLQRYAAGTERMPYQGRIGMEPIVRWAEGNPLLNRAAAALNASLQKTPQHASHPEVLGPEKLICLLLGCLAVLLMTFAATAYTARHLPQLWWLGGVLTLAILYASYAARAELNFWYPYDLPHFALFGLATLCILEGWWPAFFALFLIDTPVRETSVYLLLLCSAVAWQRGKRQLVAWNAAAFFLFWLPTRLWIVHRFAGNPGETGIRPIGILHAVFDPLHWPQLFSAGGYLLIPVWLARRHLARDQQWFIYAALPCMAVTLAFGMWYESRIFGEWTVAIAVLASTEIASALKNLFASDATPAVAA